MFPPAIAEAVCDLDGEWTELQETARREAVKPALAADVLPRLLRLAEISTDETAFLVGEAYGEIVRLRAEVESLKRSLVEAIEAFTDEEWEDRLG